MKLMLLFIVSTLLNAELTCRTQVIMGTFVSVKVDKKNEIYIEKTFNVIKKIDNTISSFKDKSTISKLNKYKEVKLDKISFEALNLSKKYFYDTDGFFNITIGSITKDLYRFGGDELIPNKKELDDAKVDFNALVFNENKALLNQNIKVDLGGMGKGYAIDKASEFLASYNVNEAIVSASGDIRCLDLCIIGVEDPFKNDVMLSFKTKKKNLGISTSGNYNRYVKDKKYNHLINPKTKRSGKNFSSITLVGDIKSSALDAYATAVSVMPKEKAYRFLDKLGVAYIVVELDAKTTIKPLDLFELLLNVK